jgi:hypothetical protein
MLKFILALLLFTSLINFTNAQVVINEVSNRNYKQFADENGDYNDWIELYNSGIKEVNLNGWALNDSKKDYEKWKFGNTVIPSGKFLLIQASGKNRNLLVGATNWESAVLPGNDFSYLIPDSSTPANWYQPEFNDSLWAIGKAGFGYGDDDDQTVVPEQTLSVFLRKKFIVPDTSAILTGVFHADYDDGFIAYLNGVKIAGANVTDNPLWNTLATVAHEAVMYSGGKPDRFDIDTKTLKSILKNGENVLCIEVHNFVVTSPDLSIIPYLSFALKDEISFFQPAPTWLYEAQSGFLHTNFKIAKEGEMIYLSDTISVIDSMKAEATQIDQSTGRITDGVSQTGIFLKATPGASNNTSVAFTQGYASTPKFSQKAGFYSSAFDLTITSSETNSSIRYTIDGSDPTETSTLYSAPIKISSTKSIKACNFLSGKMPGEIATATFFIKEEYSIPVLSVTTNSSNLYGSNGIFDNTNLSFDVPSYVEYFEKDKQLAFHQSAGMQLDGGAGGSRTLPQHSFRIEPGNGALGDGNLNYKLMPRRPNRTNYPSFYVRNGSNQFLVLPYKDALEVTALGRNTFTYYSAYHPIVVYLNGKYFGVYELREKINEDFLKDNYQMDTDSLDFLEVSYFKSQIKGINPPQLEALQGSTQPFVADSARFFNLNTQSADYLEKVGEFLDLQSYTDYIIAESWVADVDWPYNNIKIFRCKGTGYKWRWAINDLEWSLNPNGWSTSSFDHIQYMLGYSKIYTDFWNKLIQNSGYKAYFVNRFADLMNTSYNFSSVRLLETDMYNEIFPEMGGEYKLWGYLIPSESLTKFSKNHEIFRTELEKRSDFVRSHLQSHFNLSKQVAVTLEVEPEGAGSIQISTITPTNYPWEGIYFTNIPVEVTALPNLGYQFANWDVNSFINDISQATVSSKFTVSKIKLKAHFVTTNDSYDGVVISEINFKPGKNFDSPDWVEFCNLSRNDVNLKGWRFTDEDSTHVFVFEKDLILGSNQRLVVSNNQQQMKILYPDIDIYPREFNFGLGSPSDEIHLFNSENVQVVSIMYSDNYPWALSEDFSGRTLELRSPNGDMNDPTSWFRGCIGGSPGKAYQPCNEPVVSAPMVMAINNFDVKVFPVPANDFIEVEIGLDKDVDYCDAKIYNIMGSELKSVSLGKLGSGFYQTHIELNGIQESMLILKVSTNRNVRVVKIMKFR